MADNLIESLIRLAVDNSAAQRGKRAIADLRKEVRGIGTDAAKGSQQAVRELSLLERKARDVQKRIADQQARGQRGASVGQGAGKLAQVAGAIGGGAIAEPIRLVGDFAEAAERLGPAAAVGGAALGALGLVISGLQAQAEATANAIREELALTEKRVAREKEAAQLIESGDVEGARKRLADLERDQAAANIELTEAYVKLEAVRGKIQRAEEGWGSSLQVEASTLQSYIDEKTKEFQARAAEQDALTAALPAIQKTAQSRKDEAAAVDRLNATLKEAPKTVEAFGKSLIKSAVDAFAKIKAEEQRQNDERVKVAEDYNADVIQVTQDGYAKAAQLADDYAQDVISIADKAADAAEQNLADLLAQRAQLATQLSQADADASRQAAIDAQDARIAEARDEARSLREHARDLKRIRENAAEEELGMVADRDFRSLFFHRRQTALQIRQTSEDFTAQNRERRIALGEQLSDLQRHAAQEADARAIQYQRELEQANLKYQQEQTALETATAKSLATLNDGYAKQRTALTTAQNQQLNTLRMAAQEQINLVNQTEAAKRAAYQQSLNQVQQLASQVVSTTASGAVPLPHYAAGGFLGAGRSAIVGERGMETFRSGGRSTKLGFGMFRPLASGNIERAGGGKTINFNPTFNISGGGNPDLVARRVEQRVMRFLEQVTA